MKQKKINEEMTESKMAVLGHHFCPPNTAIYESVYINYPKYYSVKKARHFIILKCQNSIFDMIFQNKGLKDPLIIKREYCRYFS